jgi:hypothetical protein
MNVEGTSALVIGGRSGPGPVEVTDRELVGLVDMALITR